MSFIETCNAEPQGKIAIIFKPWRRTFIADYFKKQTEGNKLCIFSLLCHCYNLLTGLLQDSIKLQFSMADPYFVRVNPFTLR
jgi:hypothetical protein